MLSNIISSVLGWWVGRKYVAGVVRPRRRRVAVVRRCLAPDGHRSSRWGVAGWLPVERRGFRRSLRLRRFGGWPVWFRVSTGHTLASVHGFSGFARVLCERLARRWCGRLG